MNNKRSLFNPLQQGQAPYSGTPKRDPFGDNRTNIFDAVITADGTDSAATKTRYDNPVPVLFPRTRSAPEGAETVDIRRIAVLAPLESITLFSFTCNPGTTSVFFGYALFTDALSNGDVLWLPTIDNRRILAYHGDPATGYTINLAIGIDLSEAASIPCQIFMQPGQVLRWQITNQSVTNQVSMGVRMTGYLDVGQQLTSSKIGG